MLRESGFDQIRKTRRELVVSSLLVCAYLITLLFEAYIGTGDPLNIRATRIGILTIAFLALAVSQYLRVRLASLHTPD